MMLFVKVEINFLTKFGTYDFFKFAYWLVGAFARSRNEWLSFYFAVSNKFYDPDCAYKGTTLSLAYSILTTTLIFIR